MTHLQKSHIAKIQTDKCTKCKICPPIKTCQSKAISRLDLDEPPYVLTEFCVGCGECVKTCPFTAIFVDV